MKLYTSYWAQVRNFPKDLIGLNTTVWPPKWRPLGQDKRGVWIIDCPPLKPDKTCEGLCRGPENCECKDPHNCSFLKAYKNQLNNIDFESFIHKLYNLHKRITEDNEIKNYNFAFIFYEKYNNPCSERWPIQQWFKKHNIIIEEWISNI